MSNEVFMSGALQYNDGVTVVTPPSLGTLLSVTTQQMSDFRLSISASVKTALPLGTLSTSALAYALLINRDSTNYIDVYTATSGVRFARLLPNTGNGYGFALLQIGADISAPYALANTAACVLEGWLFGP